VDTFKVAAALLILTVGAASAAVTRTIVVTVLPFDIIDSNPCSGEPVQYSGTLHEELTEVFDDAGGVHSKFMLRIQQMRAVGLQTGTTFIVHSSTHVNSNSQDADGPLSISSQFHFIDPGQGSDFTVFTLFHTTVNANGEVTAEAQNFRAECK